MAIIKLGGDSGGGGDVLSRVLKGLQGKRVGRHPYHDSEGDILYFKQLLNEDTSSDVSQALLPTESSSLVPPLPDPKQICLREVERFDPFFSLTQSGGKTRVMETPSFSSHHMPSPRPAAYSPKEVMYCYYHPHLTSGDGFDHGPKMK
ncbi:hypothetical protein Tco_0813008 [Tanacetum coccineum]